MSTDERRKARRDTHTEELNQLEDDAIIGIEDFAADTTKPLAVRKHVLGQVRDLLHGVTLAGFTEPAALMSRPIAALTSGAPAAVSALPEWAKEFAEQLVKKLEGVPQEQIGARLHHAGRVALGADKPVSVVGTISLKDKQYGRLAAEADLDALSRDKTRLQADLDTADSQVETLKQQLAAIPPDNTALVTERDNLKTERDSIRANLNDLLRDLKEKGEYHNKPGIPEKVVYKKADIPAAMWKIMHSD